MQYKEIYLLLTEQCPNRCEYCYIKGRDNPSKMSIDFIFEKIEEHMPQRIIFFGGEPLLELELIEQVLEKYHGKIKFQVVTSTSANFKEFFSRINTKYPLNEVQLSWDGFDNINRVDLNDNPISNLVYENIMWLANTGLKFDVKCVIGNHNVHLMSDIHYKFKEMKKLGISGQFVIAHRDEYTDDFYVDLERELIKTFDLDKLYKDHLNQIIAYLQKDKNFASCDAGRYIVITPDGRESFCTALSQEKDLYFDTEELQVPCTHIDCINCDIKYMCDGGCRFERYNQFKDEWKSNYLKSTCRVNKIYVKTIKTFLDSLSPKDQEFLLSEIVRYSDYKKFYFKGCE